MNKIHIILLNYKNWQDTIECLESLKKINLNNFEIILVEVCNLNNSTENLKNYLKNYQIKLKFIELNENKGFAYANNQAIKYIQTQNDTEYIWILNNDTIVEENTLSSLLNFHKQKSENEKVGFVGSKILEYSSPSTIQTVGGTFNPKTGYSLLKGKNEEDINQYSEPFETDYVIGASMFFNKTLIDKIGYMPEGYFLYYEDIDWCITAQKQGYKNFTNPQSIVLHKQGAATGNKYNKKKTTSPTRKYMYSSYIKFYKKNYPKYYKRAYLILFKQFLGKIFRLQFSEAIIIFKTIFISF